MAVTNVAFLGPRSPNFALSNRRHLFICVLFVVARETLYFCFFTFMTNFESFEILEGSCSGLIVQIWAAKSTISGCLPLLFPVGCLRFFV